MADVDLDLDQMGPIDYIVVEFPPDRPVDGSAFRHLGVLVRSGNIHILDLAFVRAAAGGQVVALDVEEVGLVGSLEPHLLALLGDLGTGLLDDGVLAHAAHRLTPGTTGMVLVFENSWAAPFAVALRRTGALLVSDERVAIQAFLATLVHPGGTVDRPGPPPHPVA